MTGTADLTFLIKKGPLEIPTTRLGLMAFEGDRHAVELACKHGIDWDAEGTHALLGALYGSRLEFARQFLAAGSPFDDSVYRVAFRHCPDFFDSLPYRPDLVHELQSQNDWARFNWAIVDRKFEVAKGLYMAHKFDLNQRVRLAASMGDLGPIHHAILHGGYEFLRHLLDEGADPNFPTGDGRSPLRLMFETSGKMRWRKRRRANVTLRRRGAKLLPAPTLGEWFKSQLSIAFHAPSSTDPVDTAKSDGFWLKAALVSAVGATALALAAAGGAYAVLRGLPWEHLIVGAVSRSHVIPPPVFRAYIRVFHPIRGDLRTDNGLTALGFAVNGCIGQVRPGEYCADLLEEIIAQGGNPNAPAEDRTGLTPLHQAVLEQDLPLAEFLVAHGADPNARAGGEAFTGMTPLRFLNELEHKKDPQAAIRIEEFLRARGGTAGEPEAAASAAEAPPENPPETSTQ